MSLIVCPAMTFSACGPAAFRTPDLSPPPRRPRGPEFRHSNDQVTDLTARWA
nr:MAG TPA: hypothetical protein [Caudoviricetes sp.]